MAAQPMHGSPRNRFAQDQTAVPVHGRQHSSVGGESNGLERVMEGIDLFPGLKRTIDM